MKPKIRHCPDRFSAAGIMKFPLCGVPAWSLLFARNRASVTCGNCKRVLAAQERKKKALRARRERLTAKTARGKKKRGGL